MVCEQYKTMGLQIAGDSELTCIASHFCQATRMG